MSALLPVILAIVSDGLKLFSEERRTRFEDQYHDILKRKSSAENQTYPEYNNYDIDHADEELENFLKAYHNELSAHIAEAPNA